MIEEADPNLESPPTLSQVPPQTGRLKRWEIGFSDFGILVSMLLASMVVFSGFAFFIANLVFGKMPAGEEPSLMHTLFGSFGMQLGFLTSFLVFRQLFSKVSPSDNPTTTGRSILIGLKWLLLSYPAMIAVALVWQGILVPLGFEQNTQEPVKLIQEGGTPMEQAFLYFMVTLVAPVCEEFAFRGSIFRYLHLRTPTFIALATSGTLFALIHLNLFSFAPLVVIGIGLALAYRESGNIVSSIVFHSAFNSIQLVMILTFSDFL